MPTVHDLFSKRQRKWIAGKNVHNLKAKQILPAEFDRDQNQS